VTGSSFPEAGDPSDVDWWRQKLQRDQRRDEGKPDDDNERSHPSRDGHKMSRNEAFVVLGLHKDASVDDIKQAYRRMAQLHHPDRFANLGPDAVRAANAMFVRVKNAYEILSE
jgi:DnaJ like chaperone protein